MVEFDLKGIDMIDYRWTDGSNEDFLRFYEETENFYSSIVGGKKNREGFIPYNISQSIPDVLIAYEGDTAVACAGLKAYSDTDIEIKRVWVEPACRGKKISLALMERLEEKARTMGFTRMILQTRPQMTEAVGLYTKLGYSLIDNYPPYDKLEGAVCYAKEI